MSAPVAAPRAQRPLGSGARRAYALLLNGGGWWTLQEMSWSLEVTGPSLVPQIETLLKRKRKHITRRGEGKASAPYRYAVLTSCMPVPGVSLSEAA